jgi:ribosome-associated heat shock protein Hsp15
MSGTRLDRWLWSTRHFKTRTLAADACKRNWVKVNERTAKPSRKLQSGDLLEIRKGSLLKTVKVLDLLEKRVSANHASQFYEDMTPPEAYGRASDENQKFKIGRYLPMSKGRPSKKQRRDLEEFLLGQEDSE